LSFFPKKEFKSYEEIGSAFQEKMNETAKGKIDSELIKVVVQSSRVPNLIIFAMCMEPSLVVDKSLVAKEAIARYLSLPNTLVLCVVAADDDAKLSSSLLNLKPMEWNGSNLLGCLTKLDSSESKKILEVLRNESSALEFGWVGLVCGNHRDLQDKLTLR